jgi:uncharacterized protein YkwD
VNEIRDNHGLRRLDLNLRLSRYARKHSWSMARNRQLFHSANLYTVVRRYGARTWGENVGRTTTLRQCVRLWMKSPSHRSNLLNRRFRKTGIGVVRSGGWLWITQIYYG